MNINEAKNNYIFYTEIDLGDSNFIKLREPSIGELDGLNKASEENRIAELGKLFPTCLADHSFEDDNGNKASSKDVYAMLRDSGTLYMEIISTWMAALPFNQRLKSKET